MCEDIMADVSGCRLPGIAGTLKGHRRWSVQGEQYPAIAPDAESAVSGVVYRNVPGSAWDRLDRFEGEMYDRRPVDIELNDGSMLPAETYVIRPAFMNRLDPSDWDFDDFMSTGKESFQRHYKGYRSLM